MTNDLCKAIRLRPARPADQALLRYWDQQPHVIAAGDDDWEWETELAHTPAWREQLIAELDGRPIGFIQLIDPALEETHYWGDVPQHLRAIESIGRIKGISDSRVCPISKVVIRFLSISSPAILKFPQFLPVRMREQASILL